MLQEVKSKLEQVSVQDKIKRGFIEINNKFIKLPFFSVVPQNSTDLRLILEEFEPNKLMKDSPEGEEVDFLNAVSYRLFEHDNIIREQKKVVNQLTLSQSVSSFKYFNQTKLKLIEPATELYRLRYKGYLKQYAALEEIPIYFKNYLTGLIVSDKIDLDFVHFQFWESLFNSKEKGTSKSAHFLRWHWKRQQSRGADVFIPPTPYINLRNPSLVDRAIEMNLDARDFIKDGEVSTTFIIDMDLFNDKNAIGKITNYFDQAPTKITLLKFVNPTKILQVGYGRFAKKNFELFLRVVNSIKEEQPNRIFGVINGGAFGHALLGAGFDFFTDTVSNYPPYYVTASRGKRKHRAMLNPETLSVEKFEGVKNMFVENNILMHDCKVCEKYKGNGNIELVDRQIWSEDCRRHGLQMWNTFTKEYFEAKSTGQEKLFFDKIQNSDYAILGTILRNINTQ